MSQERKDSLNLFSPEDAEKGVDESPSQKPLNADKPAPSASVVERATGRAKEILTWTLNDFFDFNPHYLQQIRGVLNICHLVLNMLVVALIGSACQTQPYVDTTSYGFYCKSSDTFLFVIGTSSFLASLLHFACCLLSKKSETRLLSTSFEVTYYIFYSVCYFVSGISLATNVVNRNRGRYIVEDGYHTTLAGAVFGIFNCLVYGASAGWFYMYHRKRGGDDD